MNHRPAPVLLGLLLALAGAPAALGKVVSDLVSPEKRRSVVEQAQHLTRPAEPVPLPADLVQPFNPPSFDQPDPEELRASAAAAAKANVSGPPGLPGLPGTPAAPAGDREILENIASKILPTGTMKIGNEPLLIFGRKPIKIGSRFTVTNSANGQDYELELVAIEPPTFTLRYRNEEITRPIKSGKSQ